MTARILIVSCGFAPAFHPNAHRATHLARCLAEAGAEVVVLTLTEEDLLASAPYDAGLAAAVPPQARILRVDAGPLRRRLRGARDPRALLRRGRRSPLLSSLLVPDAYADCIPGLIRAGRTEAHRFRPHVVVSIAYPWSCHYVGSALSRASGARWIAEFGDPWANSPATDLNLHPLRRALDGALERRLVRRMDRIVVTTEATRELYTERYPFLQERIHVVRYGYDDAQPGDHDLSPPARPREAGDRRLWIVHTGRIYPGARSLSHFLRALGGLARERPGLDGRLALRLVGEVDEETTRSIRSSGLEELTVLVPWVPATQARAWQEAADWLLLPGNYAGVQVPSKLYEYFRAKKPILYLSEAGQDEAARLIAGVKAGWTVLNDEPSIARHLREFLDGALSAPGYDGEIPVTAFSVSAALDSYARLILETGRGGPCSDSLRGETGRGPDPPAQA